MFAGSTAQTPPVASDPFAMASAQPQQPSSDPFFTAPQAPQADPFGGLGDVFNGGAAQP